MSLRYHRILLIAPPWIKHLAALLSSMLYPAFLMNLQFRLPGLPLPKSLVCLTSRFAEFASGVRPLCHLPTRISTLFKTNVLGSKSFINLNESKCTYVQSCLCLKHFSFTNPPGCNKQCVSCKGTQCFLNTRSEMAHFQKLRAEALNTFCKHRIATAESLCV